MILGMPQAGVLESRLQMSSLTDSLPDCQTPQKIGTLTTAQEQLNARSIVKTYKRRGQHWSLSLEKGNEGP